MKKSTVEDGEMINVFPEAEAPGIGIREHWGKGKEKEGGGYIIFAMKALFLKHLINSKITCYPSSLYTKGNIQPRCTFARGC